MCAADLNYPFSYAGINTVDSYCALKSSNLLLSEPHRCSGSHPCAGRFLRSGPPAAYLQSK